MFKNILPTIAIAAAFVVAEAKAATVDTFLDFSGNGGFSDSYSFSANGIGVTVTAGRFNNNGVKDSTGLVYQNAGGLGALANDVDDSTFIDGLNRNDLLILEFDQEVIFKSITFGAVDENDDFRFFVEGVSSGLLSDLGSNIDIPSSLTYVFSSAYVGELFGIGAKQRDDDFKIAGVTVSAVPIPAAAGLMIGALAIAGWVGRRRRSEEA